MKKVFGCVCLFFLALSSTKAYADMSDLQRVHSDIHAQVTQKSTSDGRVSSGPTAIRDQGH